MTPPSPAGVPRTMEWRSGSEPLVALPSAGGDWKQWRGNPQHTGLQRVPGAIASPAVRWRYRLGGRIDPSQSVLCAAGPGLSDGRLLVSPPGVLAAYTLDGELVWKKRSSQGLQLLGCWDLAGDGRTEILAATVGLSGARLMLFGSGDGELLWTSPAAFGGLGAVKLTPLASAKGLALLWLPAAGSRITAYSLRPRETTPQELWKTDLPDFVSDPYTPSSLVVGDLDFPGREQVVISGGRHSIPTIFLDAHSGQELQRRYVTVDGHGVESGGPGQLLQLADYEGDGSQEVLTVSSYSSGEAYMFQGITVTGFGDPERDRVLDTYPFGLRYVSGSIQDFDGDGRSEILVSRYVPEAGRHDLLLLDAATLGLRGSVPNFYLKAVVGSSGGWVILGAREVASEVPSGREPLTVIHYDGIVFKPTSQRWKLGMVAGVLPRAFDAAAVENPGDAAVLFSATNGDEAILLFDNRKSDGIPDELAAADLDTGELIARWGIGPGVRLGVLAAAPASDPSRTRFVVAGADGSITFLDGALRVVRTVAGGGYYQADSLNGHSYETAAVADLDGKGRPDVVVVDSLNRVVKLTGLADASPLQEPGGQVLWDSGISQELLAVPTAPRENRLVVRGGRDGFAVLRMIDGSGNPSWEQPFDDLPLGLAFGHFRSPTSADLVASIAGSTGQRRTCLVDGRSGEIAWISDSGTYWDATFAAGDADGDGLDDILFNYNAWKGYLLKGSTGRLLTEPVNLPVYEKLESVDYNGALVALGAVGQDGSFLVLNAEDNAHLALLSVERDALGLVLVPVAESWSIEQALPDDERRSMVAVAPVGRRDWIAAVGSRKGTIRGVTGADGSVLWETGLWNGKASAATAGQSDEQSNDLSSVVALDVNGDGRMEFVVGGYDGWLYALDAATGALVWSLDLGAPVGDPIAADTDGDGLSEILAPTADGYLYSIGPGK